MASVPEYLLRGRSPRPRLRDVWVSRREAVGEDERDSQLMLVVVAEVCHPDGRVEEVSSEGAVMHGYHPEDELPEHAAGVIEEERLALNKRLATYGLSVHPAQLDLPEVRNPWQL